MILEAAVVTCSLFVVIVLGSLAYNPRLWIQDFPKEMQAEMAPLSRGERLGRGLVAILLVGLVIGMPLLSVLRLKSAQGSITFLEAFLHIWLVFMSVNIVDIVIIDWAIGLWWQPDVLSTPEIQPLSQHNTYQFHRLEHFKGTLLLTAVALVLSGLVSLG